MLRIYINQDRQFEVNGKRIWMNGVNTPWHHWEDFGKDYDDSWWDTEFARISSAGINSSRVWISCVNSSGVISIEDSGMITGIKDQFWSDLDKFFETAKKHRIYIMATLISHNHFMFDKHPETGERINGGYPAAAKWQAMLKSKEASESFAEHYTIPFVKRYGDNPYFWSIDLCNEMDQVFEEPGKGQVPWENIQYWVAYNASAIHKNSKVLVTFGLTMPKYNSDRRKEGNQVSDARLQAQYPDEDAYIDFWSPHYYDWCGQWFGIMPNETPQKQGLDISKPAVIGECPAKGIDTNGFNPVKDYENAFNNGWQGVLAWTSNGVDINGSLKEVSSATKNMLEKHPKLVFPFFE
ncbi:MAG: hypothetical protein LBH43_14670 [Treponema sp.]|jgi:hypothetical protein|nr:hypothetical protein [Treponema sp.]